MQNTITNLHLNSVKRKSQLRKFIFWIRHKRTVAKFGYGLFGGTALFGTAVLVASATGGNNIIPEHQVPAQITHQTQPLTTPSPEMPVTSAQSNNSDESQRSSSDEKPQENNRTSVNVNGENIELNGDGEIHRTIKNGNSTTQVDISVDSSGSNSSSSHTHVQSHSFSSGTSSINVNNSLELNN